MLRTPASDQMTSCKAPTGSSTSATTMVSCADTTTSGEVLQQHLALWEASSAVPSTASRRTRPASGSPTSSTTRSVASTSSPLRARIRSSTSLPTGSILWARLSRSSMPPGLAMSRSRRTARVVSPATVRSVRSIRGSIRLGRLVSARRRSAQRAGHHRRSQRDRGVTEIFADLIARLTPTPSGPQTSWSSRPRRAQPRWTSTRPRTATSGSPRTSAATSLGSPRLVWSPRPPRRSTSPTRNGRDPIGITIAANGQPWYSESLIDKVANVQLR